MLKYDKRKSYTNIINYKVNNDMFFNDYVIIKAEAENYKPKPGTIPSKAISYYCDKIVTYYLLRKEDTEEVGIKNDDFLEYRILKLLFRSLNMVYNNTMGGPVEKLISGNSKNIHTLEFNINYRDGKTYFSVMGHQYEKFNTKGKKQPDKYLTSNNQISNFCENDSCPICLQERSGSPSTHHNSIFATSQGGKFDMVNKTKSYSLQEAFNLFYKSYSKYFEELSLSYVEMNHIEDVDILKSYDNQLKDFLSNISFEDKTGIIEKQDIEFVINNQVKSFDRNDRNKSQNKNGLKDFSFTNDSKYKIITIFDKDYYNGIKDEYKQSLTSQHLTISDESNQDERINKDKLRTCLTELFIKYLINEGIDLTDVILNNFLYHEYNSDNNYCLRNGKLDELTEFEKELFDNIASGLDTANGCRFVKFNLDNKDIIYCIRKTSLFLMGDESEDNNSRRQNDSSFFNFLRGINFSQKDIYTSYISSGFISDSIGSSINTTIKTATYLYEYNKYIVHENGMFENEEINEDDYEIIYRMLSCPFIRNNDRYSIMGIGFKYLNELITLNNK